MGCSQWKVLSMKQGDAANEMEKEDIKISICAICYLFLGRHRYILTETQKLNYSKNRIRPYCCKHLKKAGERLAN